MKTTSANPPAKAKLAAKAYSRAAHRVPPKATVSKLRGTPGAQPLPASLRSPRASALPTPAQGAIKLSFPMTPLAITALVHNIAEGLKDNLNYPDFTAWETTLLATEGALIASMDAVTTADAAAKAARAARDLAVLNAENDLKNVALTCEAVDRTDEALISAGWELRRTAGGPKPLPAPARLAMKNLPYEGQVQVRWTAVTNKQYYEIKAAIGGENVDPNIWETLPILPEGRVTRIFKDLPVGSYLSVRVRAVGSRGPSPWTEAVTLRVN